MKQPEEKERCGHSRPQGFLRRGRLAGASLCRIEPGRCAGIVVGEIAARDQRNKFSHCSRASDLQGDPTTAEILVDTLIRWGVSHVFGIVGDGINPIIEALRKRKSEIQFVGVRHEEAAAFMAGGFAKHTGKLGVCLGTTGPGAIHLMNGLYDAHYDGAPVLAITGTTFHDLIGTRFMQGVDTVKLMEPVAALNVQITGPAHASIVVNHACRTALGNRCVAHVTIPKDLQAMKLSADKPSMENHGLRTSESWSPVASAPDAQQLQAAANILNSGKRVAILAGQGALAARAEVQKLAETLGAPVAKALLGKAVLPDDSPYTTGGIGHLGTQPSQWIMQNCDTLLILGSTMPWIDSYPKQGSARAVQIDIKADHIGLRYPTELGLVGDVKTTLAALLPLLQRKADRSFLTEAQRRMQDWMKLLDQVEQRGTFAPASTNGGAGAQRPDRAGRGDLARLRLKHVFRGPAFAPPRRAAFDQSRDAGDDGAWSAIRDCGAIRVSESPERGSRWRRRIRHVDGGIDDGGSTQSAGQDCRPEKQQPVGSTV